MKKVLVFLLVFSILSTVSLFAQNWSKNQLQAWQVIEDRWDNLVNQKNLEAFSRDFHPEFKGFVNWRALPIDREILKQGADNVINSLTFSMYVIEPTSITISGDAAVIHYFCNTRGKTNGKLFQSEFKYTDFLVKENGKWLTLGAHKEKL